VIVDGDRSDEQRKDLPKDSLMVLVGRATELEAMMCICKQAICRWPRGHQLSAVRLDNRLPYTSGAWCEGAEPMEAALQGKVTFVYSLFTLPNV
jgi:hypothetical protein